MRLSVALALLVTAAPLFACRIILPPPVPPLPPVSLRAMEVREHRADIHIRDQVAVVTVQAIFYNPNDRQLEGTYYFPVDPRAAVSSFSMTVNGKTLEAEVLPADQARKTYEDIVRRLQDPAILEYVDQGMLRARVFPIAPRGEVKIQLGYEQQIGEDGGLSRCRYPLLSTRPGGGNPVQNLVLNIELETRAELKTVYTPGFTSQVERRDDRHATIRYTAANVRPDADFELVYGTAAGVAGANFLGWRNGDDGYFMLAIAPRSELQQEELAAKDVTFVVDTSGSMQGAKIEQARKALDFCLDGLKPTDRFSIISFATDVVPLAPEPLVATPGNRRQAHAFVADLVARGGTAIDDAVAAALAVPRRADAVSLVVFLTDGRPTVGRVEANEILDRFKDGGAQRFFTFGVGDDVDTRLLNAVAEKTRGHVTYVRPGEDLELALSSFFTKVASPVLTDLELVCPDAQLSMLQPRDLPDLFRGQQLVVSGRYRGQGTVRCQLRGRVGKTVETIAFSANLDGDPRNAFVRRLWAVRRVAWLEDQVRVHGEQAELVDEIRRLGREFGIITPHTSMLIVEQGMQVSAAARPQFRQRMQESRAAMGQASGAPAADYAQDLAAAKAAPVAPATLMASGYARRLRESLGVDERQFAELVRVVGERTFYRRGADGLYIDSALDLEHPPTPEVTVTAWSPEFFALVARHPELRRFMLLEATFLVRLDGQVIQVRMPE